MSSNRRRPERCRQEAADLPPIVIVTNEETSRDDPRSTQTSTLTAVSNGLCLQALITGRSISLPNEVWLNILHRVPYFDLRRCSRVSKQLHGLVQTKDFDDTLFRSPHSVSNPYIGAEPSKEHRKVEPFKGHRSMTRADIDEDVRRGNDIMKGNLVIKSHPIFDHLDFAVTSKVQNIWVRKAHHKPKQLPLCGWKCCGGIFPLGSEPGRIINIVNQRSINVHPSTGDGPTCCSHLKDKARRLVDYRAVHEFATSPPVKRLVVVRRQEEPGILSDENRMIESASGITVLDVLIAFHSMMQFSSGPLTGRYETGDRWKTSHDKLPHCRRTWAGVNGFEARLVRHGQEGVSACPFFVVSGFGTTGEEAAERRCRSDARSLPTTEEGRGLQRASKMLDEAIMRKLEGTLLHLADIKKYEWIRRRNCMARERGHMV